MLKALIFDVDGTMSLTERDGHRVAFNRAFAEAGLDWTWDTEEYGRLLKVTGGRERLRHYMQISGKPESESLINRVHGIKTRHYIEIVNAGEIHLRTGVRRLATEAHAAGIKLGVATTTTRSSLDALLARWLPDLFDVICTAEDALSKKPDPLVYRVALRRLNVLPEECVALEDSEAGLGAADRAGIPTLITVNDYTRDENFGRARAVLSDLGEPGAPPRVISGDAPSHGFVDVAYLRELVERTRDPLRAAR